MMVRRMISSLMVLFLVMAVGWACQPDEEERMEPGTEEMVLEPMMEAAPADTTARAVWSYLEEQAYQDNWPLWPGKARLYQGTEPHGALLTTYVNDSAMVGLTALRTDPLVDDLPFGSMVVKENYLPDSTLAAVTVMMKAEGYDPAHHDWFWMKQLADGTVEASGRVQSCIDCHSEALNNWDYLMTALDQWGAEGTSQ